MRDPRKIFYYAGALTAVAALLIIVYAGWAKLGPPHTVEVGTPIRHDDFLLMVTQVRKRELADRTTIYSVRVNVRNQAMVVNYRWNDYIAYVNALDAGGWVTVSHRSRTGNSFSPPGDERTAMLEFRLPPDVSEPTLRFWDGVFMGDVFNGVAYAKAAVPL